MSKTLIFLHISKAGGSTLNHILDWNYDRTRTITVYKQIPPLIALPDEEKRQIQCLKGMVFYGIHHYLPQECEYITILRHPIDRVISHYYHLFARKRRLGEPIHDMSLEDVLELEPFWTTYQLRLLVGGSTIESVLHDPLPEHALEIAQQNLARHFVMAGVLDYYDETLLLMKHTCGWTRAFYARQNIGQRRAPRGDISAATRRRLEQDCALEMQLYQYVKQQTETLIAQQGPGFQTELTKLRQANTRFERLYRVAEPLRNTPLWGWARRLARGINQRG